MMLILTKKNNFCHAIALYQYLIYTQAYDCLVECNLNTLMDEYQKYRKHQDIFDIFKIAKISRYFPKYRDIFQNIAIFSNPDPCTALRYVALCCKSKKRIGGCVDQQMLQQC